MSRPVIGVTSNFRTDPQVPHRPQCYLDAVYPDAVLAAGGLAQPVPVPAEYDETLLDELVAAYDGLLFTGGFDLQPHHFGQAPHPRATPLHDRRDRFEVDFFRRADGAGMPILGLCLGHQVAHVARGGGLIQHIDDVGPAPATTHYLPDDVNAFHHVRIEPDSRLAEIVGHTGVQVNSRHHQIVDPQRVGAGLRSVAFSADGVLEASEDCDGRFLLTVQWHPEDLVDRPEHLRLFQALVEQARQRRPR